MDMRTGQMFTTEEEALAAGVPKSDLALIEGVDPSRPETWPLVQFDSGPFKNRTYRRMPNGQLVRQK
jgi:hypothetical protein